MKQLVASESLARGMPLSLLSQYRYGVSPIVNACYVALLVHRFPTDELTLAQQERGRKGQTQGRTSAAPQVAPPSVPGPPAPRRVEP